MLFKMKAPKKLPSYDICLYKCKNIDIQINNYGYRHKDSYRNKYGHRYTSRYLLLITDM